MSKVQLPVVITPTRVELANRCYRRHALADILTRAAYYSPSLEFGSVAHAGAAAWWLGQLDRLPMQLAHANARKAVAIEWDKRFESRQISQKNVSLDMALAMVDRYVETAKLGASLQTNDERPWQLVAVEERVEVPLVDGMKLSFQTDRVVYDKTDDHLVIVDTKTAGRIDGKWMRGWDLSLQMMLYKRAARTAYGIENVDVVIEGWLKDVPSVVQYVVCPDWDSDQLDEAWESAIKIALRDRELISYDNLPRDLARIEQDALTQTEFNYNDCFSYNVECPFRKLCVATPSERIGILHGEYFEIPDEEISY